MSRSRIAVVLLLPLALAACRSGSTPARATAGPPITAVRAPVTTARTRADAQPREPAAAEQPSAGPSLRAPATTPTPAAPSLASSPTPSPTRSAGDAPSTEPRGFPIDPALRTGLVTGAGASRRIAWGAGPQVAAVSRDEQAAAEPERANRAGWNCRTHQEYEGRPAVDWYLPRGTPVRATMDGIATLYIVTVSNAFDVYGVDRRPYLGNPDRAHAAVAPFPGPGGGKGVFVRIEGGGFATEYAHLDLADTAPLVPAGAFLAGFAPGADLVTRFAPLREFTDMTAIARWSAHRGDRIGVSGDSGYSEAPHLHYTVSRAGGPLLCPTAESGFADGGWLFH